MEGFAIADPPRLFAQEDQLGILVIDAAALRQGRPAGPVAETIPLAGLMGCAQFRLM